MKKLLERLPLLTLGLGQTKGGEVRVMEWRAGRARCLAKFLIPFNNEGGGKWYGLTALKEFWTTPRKELGGETLSGLSSQYAGAGFTSWGADLVLLDESNEPLGAINYPSALACKAVSDEIGALKAKWWHTNFGGASQAAFQPLGVLKYMLAHLPASVWPKVRTIVPVTDYLTYLLTGEKGNDTTMAQSQGLLSGKACRLIEKHLGAPIPEGSINCWPDFGTDTVIERDGFYAIPGSHDSVFARLVGFSGAPYVVWTGSWIGVAASLEETGVTPGKATLEAGLSFEGLAPRAVQTNTGMFGPVYRELIRRAELDYAEASRCITGLDGLPEINPAELGCREAPDAADFVVSALEAAGLAPTMVNALGTVMKSAVASVWADLQKLQSVIGVPLQKVSVVGGWANNTAFLELLTQRGVEVVVPPHAANATDVGFAADMLRRITVREGHPQSMADILKEMPSLD